MHVDAETIRAFYESPLGHLVRRLLRQRLRASWPDVKGCRVMALGYGTPFLGVFRGEADRLLACAPATQGVVGWPRKGGRATALVEETHLPLPDASVDRLLVVHALETSETIRPLLREIWRVLADDGRVLAVVPNRLSFWARAENTPFGHGRPFTRGQLDRLLSDSLFAPEGWSHALHLPPMTSRPVLASAGVLERVGPRAWGTFAGVHIVEATKALYGASGLGAPATARMRLARPQAAALAKAAAFKPGPDGTRPPRP
jgi:SAM-dependent methyltransferase